MLTECLTASPTASDDPLKEFANGPVGQSPSQDGTGQFTVFQSQISKERNSFGSIPHPEQLNFKEDVKSKEKVALLLTELEVRVISPVEAQELSRTSGDALQTLTISPQTKEVSEIQLNDRPLLVFLKEEESVKEAYRLLHSLLESSKPMPNPRTQQGSLVEALRRGIKTGERVLTLQHHMNIEMEQNSVNSTVKSNRLCSSFDDLSNQSRKKEREDIRHSTYKRLDSLEETIRELEKTLIEISGHPTAEQLYNEITAQSPPVQMTGSPTLETKKPPVPPKPSPLSPALIQGGNVSSVSMVLHSSAASKLKHLQQNSTDKTKGGKREDLLNTQGQQQTQGANSTSGSIEPSLSGLKTGIFSGRAPYTAAAFAPNLRKYPHEGAIPSLTTSSSQAKALLASLTASGLSAEALLLSSTLRHHRLLREQRASSLPPPSSQSSSPTPPASSSSSSPSSPTTLTPSLSPSSPTPFSSLAISSAVLKRSACSLDSSILNNCKEDGSNPVNKDLTPRNSK